MVWGSDSWTSATGDYVAGGGELYDWSDDV